MHQHLAGALLHVEHFDLWLVTPGGVLHPLGDGLGANPVLTFIEHIGVLSEKTGDRRGVAGIGGSNVSGDGGRQCRGRMGHGDSSLLVDSEAMLEHACVSSCQE
ncbi:hypothetical protein D3C84_477870 [compost metagenome]